VITVHWSNVRVRISNLIMIRSQVSTADILHKQKICMHDSDRESTTLTETKTYQMVSSFVLWFEISHLPTSSNIARRAASIVTVPGALASGTEIVVGQ
jgi:hypothetical protein